MKPYEQKKLRFTRPNDITIRYKLPDYTNDAEKFGRIISNDEIIDKDEQILILSNERFTVPEVIFSPGYIDLNQVGLAEAIKISISESPNDLQGLLWANIVVIGGNACIPNFHERL